VVAAALPEVGDWVRLTTPRGVTSPSMRAQVGEVGTVLDTRERGGELLVQVAFSTVRGVDDVFWLKPGEWTFVGSAPAATPRAAAVAPPTPPDPPAITREEVPTVADFGSAVQRRIDQLIEDDAALEVVLRDTVARRAALGKERKALEAAVGAYNRVRGGAGPQGPRALPAAALGEKTSAAIALLREWATQHDGTVVRRDVARVASDRGLTADNLSYALQTSTEFERVERGVYRLRAPAA